MSCGAPIVAITAARSPFSVEAKSVLAPLKPAADAPPQNFRDAGRALSEKIRSIFRRRCTLRKGPCTMKSRSCRTFDWRMSPSRGAFTNGGAVGRLNVGAEFRNPGRRSLGPSIRTITIRPSELGQVTAEVQFEVAPNAVTDTTELGTARLRTGPAQHWEDHDVARLKLGSCWRAEPVDLRLGCG